MTTPREEGPRWPIDAHAADVLAVDPIALGGARLRARPGPVRDAWLARLRAHLPDDRPWRRLPAHAAEERVLGGLDLAATLRAQRAVSERGLLAQTDGGVLVVPMAERTKRATVAHLCRALDLGAIRVERDGLSEEVQARLAVVALDEGLEDEAVTPALLDRLALHIDLDRVRPRELEETPPARIEAVAEARARLPDVELADAQLEALCGGALALGVGSLRVPVLAARVARAHAALAGRTAVEPEDLAFAAAFVLGPRATRMPAPEEDAEAPPEEPPPEEPPQDQDEDRDEDRAGLPDAPLEDLVLAAAASAMPTGLLDALVAGLAGRGPRGAGGVGDSQESLRRGRPAGSRPGRFEGEARLDVVSTLRAAAPWQPLRRRGDEPGEARRVHVTPSDFRIRRFKQPRETLTIFCVDASGSAALQRLAEAKGAVERVLAECYVRRDQVALLAFRQEQASLLLPPTRSLVRAKRALAGLPGGGTTPIGAGIEAAGRLAQDALRKGQTPLLVFMTDGKANVSRSGARGRAEAQADALAAARGLGALGFRTLFVDTSVRPQPQAKALGEALRATYLHLPRGDGDPVAQAVLGEAAPAR